MDVAHASGGYMGTYAGLARTIYIYTVYIRYFWQGNHQIYGHIRCIYTVLANPLHTVDVTNAGTWIRAAHGHMQAFLFSEHY